jgi:hypothetical protein
VIGDRAGSGTEGLGFHGRKYCDQIKPFIFLLTCHLKPFGHPTGVDPEHFQLIAPYEPDAKKWLKMKWIDRYSGKSYWITTTGHHGTRNTARVKTYGDVIREYAYHPESKCADAVGSTCDKQTVGLLQRRHISIDRMIYIGKESNSLEEVEAGIIHDEQNVYTEYPDPRRSQWQTKVLPALKRLPLAFLIEKAGLSERALLDIRAGRSNPRQKNRELLAAVVRKLGLI